MAKLTMSRRSFAKLSLATAAATAVAATTAGAALAEQAAPAQEQGDVKRVRTCCRGCGKMECGVWVTVQNGRAVKIEGDQSAFASEGNCCTKSQASLQAAYHPARMYHPMKRTAAKGEADPGWQRITWDEAFQLMATGFQELIDKYGGECLTTFCGTSRNWCMQSAGGILYQLFGSPNGHSAYQICKGPRHVATAWQSGKAYSWMAQEDRPLVYVQWGGAQEMSNYDSSCRSTVNVTMQAEDYIIVDPRRTNLGKESKHWLPLRPGTDAAMGLAWTHVVIDNNLYDEMYVRRWTDAPFLYCADIEPTGFMGADPEMGFPFPVATRLLKESDIKEGGSPKRFMVYDELAGTDDAHPLRTNDPSGKLSYFDAETMLWEGETYPEAKFYESPQKNLVKGTVPGRIAYSTDFSGCAQELLPAISGGPFEVTLKDGSTHSVTTAWMEYADLCAQYAPEIAEGITGVPAAEIEEAAKIYATRIFPDSGYGNGGINYSLAIEHSANAVQNCRVFDALAGICGNFDTPAGQRGGTVGTFPEQFAMMSEAAPFKQDATKMLGIDKMPTLAHCYWGDAQHIIKAMNGDGAYRIRGGYGQSGDFLNAPNSKACFEGMKQMDFFAMCDLWFHPGTQLADVIVPAQHWMELDSTRRSQGSGGAEGAHCRCIEPPADTRFDVDISIGLYKAMGVPWALGDNPWPDATYNLNQMAQAGYGMSWDEYKEHFQKNGWTDCKEKYPVWGTYRRYEVGMMRRDGLPGFPTPTGKQEIWNTLLESYYPDERYTLPTFTEPPEGPVANPELCKEYPYIMTTGRRIPVYFHSEHRQLPWCRELWPTPRVEINPEDAAELGIQQGDWVWIETSRGKIRQTADLYYGINKGVVNCEHQWWLPEFTGLGKGFDLVNVNTLASLDNQCPLCGAANARAYNVKIYKATPENSPNGNPVPCDTDGTPMIVSCDDPRLKEWLPNYEIRKEA
ncbi:molybdopterin-containing oxidoreductase family protein [Parvibacter caecicola]|uniref:Molybdopterin dinucleotide-binding protein n=1 Tax=Parvibacter caecicola TaxID=747645 RepID=A0A4T9TGW6_9ACTN|nr:molybdopterin dinucleotide binding domain-containing protein [Parvibacter caecicola]TJW09958.1 molybdopterin dinucleotide-binding protein [Parvibacter caecicola]